MRRVLRFLMVRLSQWPTSLWRGITVEPAWSGNSRHDRCSVGVSRSVDITRSTDSWKTWGAAMCTLLLLSAGQRKYSIVGDRPARGPASFPRGGPSWLCQMRGRHLLQHLNPHCAPMLLPQRGVLSETGSTSSTGTGSRPLSRIRCVRIYPVAC